jgi:gas vesicle protein
MSSPEQIQRQIEQTRAQLSGDVDRLSEKVSPGRVMSRNVGRVKSGANSLRDRVMGSAQAGTGVRGATDSLSDAADTVKDGVTSAPQALRGHTQGNPLAAGLIAFGVGLLVSSLAPASRAEQQAAANAEAKAKELAEPLKQSGQELAQELKEPAQQAVEQVRSSATQAVSDTTERAKSAAQDVKEPLQR